MYDVVFLALFSASLWLLGAAGASATFAAADVGTVHEGESNLAMALLWPFVLLATGAIVVMVKNTRASEWLS